MVLAGLIVAGVVYAQFYTPAVEVSTTETATSGGTGGVAIPTVVVETNESEEIEKTKDTDHDGLSDYQEKQIGTDPNNVDTDGDWISDKVEIEIGTGPTKIDTDGDGIDDFNEYYTYPHLLDPNDPTDAERFIAMIPNVTAKAWSPTKTGIDDGHPFEKIIEIAKRDPLVQWYVRHTEIKWDKWIDENGKMRECGNIEINSEPFCLGKRNDGPTEYGIGPAYFFTHGKRGNCLEKAVVLKTILEIKGNKCEFISGEINENGHEWLETVINGQIYVVCTNTIIPRERFYEEHNWTFSDSYDPNWYLKEPNM